MASKILVIEDDPQIQETLDRLLLPQGYSLIQASTLKEAQLKIGEMHPDGILLDLQLPDGDGFHFLTFLRPIFKGPIIIMSVHQEEERIADALDAGADDYIRKPFHAHELLARLRAGFRHWISQIAPPMIFDQGRIKADFDAHRVWNEGKEVHLTAKEFELFKILAQHPGKVLTHRFILTHLWGEQVSHEVHYLRVYMRNLRQKLEKNPYQPKLLLNEPAVGYRLFVEG